jgi:hypothetical protein
MSLHCCSSFWNSRPLLFRACSHPCKIFTIIPSHVNGNRFSQPARCLSRQPVQVLDRFSSNSRFVPLICRNVAPWLTQRKASRVSTTTVPQTASTPKSKNKGARASSGHISTLGGAAAARMPGRGQAVSSARREAMSIMMRARARSMPSALRFLSMWAIIFRAWRTGSTSRSHIPP